MTTNTQNDAVVETARKGVCVKVLGVGGAGINVMGLLLKEALPATPDMFASDPPKSGLPGVSFAAVDTDAQALAGSGAAEKLQLETALLRGLGTGGDPERGRTLAEEQLPRLKALCEGADVVFILAGLGGGAGTGMAPVLARAAKETGALVLAFVTTPFQCEGTRRHRVAQHGLAELKAAADGAICLPNQQVFKMIDENTSVLDTFKITNEFLVAGVRGVWRLLLHKGLIEIHFADLAALLRDRHAESTFAVAEAFGPTRSREVMDKLLAHPMLKGGQVLGEAEAVLVSLMGGPDLTMAEVNRVMEQVNRQCEHAQVVMGAAIDEAFKERLAVTLIATSKSPEADAAGEAGASESGEELEKQLLPRISGKRPGSRFVPPAPALPPDQVQQLLSRQGRGGRSRKAGSGQRQGQLPLEIISKGRFDKSEPTIHKGEDLDVPTYIRRGVALN
jgi:cell division protein FtsZ